MKKLDGYIFMKYIAGAVRLNSWGAYERRTSGTILYLRTVYVTKHSFHFVQVF